MEHDRRPPTDVPPVATAPGSGPNDERLSQSATVAWQEGRYQDAAAVYRELLARDPRLVDARLGLVRALEAADQPEAAIAALGDAIELAPDQTEYLVIRGSILGRLLRFADAEADLRRVLKLHPAHAPALHELGLLFLRKGLAAPAAEMFQRSLSLQPDRPAAYLHLGEALNRSGDFAGAATALQRAIQLDPSSRPALNTLARVLDRLGRPDEAEALYRKAQDLET
jgi:protein O-GlcNAc transferase